MKKLKAILCFYITVIVMLTVAVGPFWANADFFEVSEDNIIFENESTSSLNTQTEEKSTVADFENISENINDSEDEYSSVLQELTSENVSEETPSYVDTNSGYIPGDKNEKVEELFFFSENIGFLESETSINTYTFTLDSRSMFKYTLTHDKVEPGEGWNVSLYAEYFLNGVDGAKGFRLINSLDTVSDNTKDSSVSLGLSSGNYRLVVTKKGTYTADNYQIDVVSEYGAKYEIECNDNIYRYTEIYDGVSIKGTASKLPDRQDEDFYLIRVYEDGFLELGFSHPEVKDKTTVCWQVVLFGEDKTELYSVNSKFTDTMNQSGKIGVTKGNYYIQVKNRVYTDITYTLTVKRFDNVGFESEKNDTMKTANLLSVNSTVSGTISEQINNIDRDYYKFTLSEKGFVVIEFAHAPLADDENKNGWNYKLYNSDEKLLFSGISAWSDDVGASCEIGLSAGTYYIAVDSENLYHNPEKYYLTVLFTACGNYESEYNNTFETANTITYNTEMSAHLAECEPEYDYDYFMFTLNETSDVNVYFKHEALDYSREIFTFTLYDSNYNTVFTAKENGTISVKSDKEKVTAGYKELPAGTYYVKVSSGIFFDNIKYTISYKGV